MVIKMKKITKKITRKGCRNVQKVWHEPEFEDSDGEWMIEKIHPNKPAVYVTKKIMFIGDALNNTTYKRLEEITKFPYSRPGR